MFKAITLAAALTLTEAVRSKSGDVDHDVRPEPHDEGCNEADISGFWTWHGGDHDGEPLELVLFDQFA